MVFESVTAKETIDMRALAKAMKVSYEEIQNLNPAYKTQYAPVLDGEAYVRVPQGTKEVALQSLEGALVRGKRFLAESEIPLHKNSYMKYKVQRGETLEKIAERFDVTVDEIAKINRVRKKRLRPGTTLKIPQNSAAVNGRSTNFSLLHIVRKGETLTRIAQKHGISVALLAKANGLNPQQNLYYGQKISIPK
jgi:LysM repeat protein